MNDTIKQFLPGYAGRGTQLNVSFQIRPRKTWGESAYGNELTTIIKVNENHVGVIQPPIRYHPNKNWRLHFAVKNPVSNADVGEHWHWIYPKGDFSSEPEARVYIKENIHKIAQKYHSHILDS